MIFNFFNSEINLDLVKSGHNKAEELPVIHATPSPSINISYDYK